MADQPTLPDTMRMGDAPPPGVPLSLKRRQSVAPRPSPSEPSTPGFGESLTRSAYVPLAFTEKKKVFVIYTGGTIGMTLQKDGSLGPQKGYLTEQLRSLPEIVDQKNLECDIHEWEEVLDSSDVEIEDWKRLALEIRDHYLDYDGFVVVHGTDTMAYTACALSFMLENLAKPVVITGSQIPFVNFFNDARRNLIVSIMYAAEHDIPEVCIFFNNVLLRGCRATKTDANGLSAFTSPNCPVLGTLATQMSVNTDIVLNQPKSRFRTYTEFSSEVCVFSLTPGFSDRALQNLLQPPLAGLVLCMYGVGNAPQKRAGLMKTLKSAIDRGVVIVVVSQCLTGRVNLTTYANGLKLHGIGVVSGGDLTRECAAVKLAYLLGKKLPPDEVKRLMMVSLRGELTPSPP